MSDRKCKSAGATDTRPRVTRKGRGIVQTVLGPSPLSIPLRYILSFSLSLSLPLSSVLS